MNLSHHARYDRLPRVTDWVCAECARPARMVYDKIMAEAPPFD